MHRISTIAIDAGNQREPDSPVCHSTSNNRATDSQFLKIARSGKANDFEPLILRYEKPIFCYLYKILKSREEAEDLTQETFIRAFNGLGKLDEDAAFKPWLYRIATNLAINELRKRKTIISLDQEEGQALHLESSERSAPNQLSRQRIDEAVRTAVSELPAEIATIVHLYYQDDLNTEQIAGIVEKSPGAVRVVLHRARQKLADLLKSFKEEQS